MAGKEYVEASSDSDYDYRTPWILHFCHKRGNEYFCVVDTDFILDRFNLAGLGHDMPHAQDAYELIADNNDFDESGNEVSEEILSAAKLLYGMIHARFIISPSGLNKMKKKYLAGEFGVCPRVMCNGQMLIPVGLSDIPRTSTVKVYCCHCEDVYNPKSSAHNAIDGAFFGTSFPHLFLQSFPHLRPTRSEQVYVPKIFGFKIANAVMAAKFHNAAQKENAKETREKEHQMSMEQ